MKTIYIAGASKEITRVKLAMAALRENGWTITYDWTEAIDINPGDHLMTREQLRPYAEADLKGIRDADYFWLMVPDNQSVGAWVELGYALSYHVNRPDYIDLNIVASGNYTRSLFTTLIPDPLCFDTDVQAKRFLCDI